MGIKHDFIGLVSAAGRLYKEKRQFSGIPALRGLFSRPESKYETTSQNMHYTVEKFDSVYTMGDSCVCF